MDNNRLTYLFELYLAGKISPEEEIRLMELLAEPVNKPLTEKLLDEFILKQEGNSRISAEESRELLDAIFKANGPEKSNYPVHRVHFMRKWGWAAASVILLASVCVYLWSVDRGRPEPSSENPPVASIPPGSSGAILTLADGAQVLLDTISNGVVALQGGATARVVNGMLLYEGNGKEIVYNSVSTPKGRKYHVTLPDSSIVWLNASSSIRYPTTFVDDVRRVEIKGEAYFEVARNKQKPFRLLVNDRAEIEVLGTSFNVNAYDNEPSLNTTLITGSVKVFSGQTDAQVLKPGQQGQIPNAPQDAAGKKRIRVIDHVQLDKVLAWKNDLFYFEGLSLKEIMRQAERWYNIEVEYKNGAGDNSGFVGKMTRDVSLDQFLESLSDLGVNYKLKGRTVIILPR